MPTLTQGVAVAKHGVAQRLRHLEKTRDQKAPTIVKTMLFHFLDPLGDQRREGRVYIHKEQRIGGPTSPGALPLSQEGIGESHPRPPVRAGREEGGGANFKQIR